MATHLPPGAAHISNTRSPALGSSTRATSAAGNDCKKEGGKNVWTTSSQRRTGRLFARQIQTQTHTQTHTHTFCERVSIYLRDRTTIAVSSRGHEGSSTRAALRGQLYEGSSTRAALRGGLYEDSSTVRRQLYEERHRELYEERHTTRASEPYLSTIYIFRSLVYI